MSIPASTTSDAFGVVIRSLWTAISTFEGLKAALGMLPGNPLVELGPKWRSALKSKICSASDFTDDECKHQVNDVRRYGDDEARLGGKIEMLVIFFVFFTYPACVLIYKRSAPARSQILVHFLAVFAWVASTAARAYLAFHSPPYGKDEQCCIHMLIGVLYVLLALAMWNTLPRHSYEAAMIRDTIRAAINGEFGDKLDDIRQTIARVDARTESYVPQQQQQQQQQPTAEEIETRRALLETPSVRNSSRRRL